MAPISPRVRSPDPQRTEQLIDDPFSEYLNQETAARHVRFASQDQIIEPSKTQIDHSQPSKHLDGLIVQHYPLRKKTLFTKLNDLIWRVREAVSRFFQSLIALPKKAFYWVFGNTCTKVSPTPPQPAAPIDPSPIAAPAPIDLSQMDLARIPSDIPSLSFPPLQHIEFPPSQITPVFEELLPQGIDSPPELPVQQAPLAKKSLPLLDLLTEQGAQKRGVFRGARNLRATEFYEADAAPIRLNQNQRRVALLYSAVHGLHLLWKACEKNLILTQDVGTSLFIDSIVQEAFVKASKEEEIGTHINHIIFNPSCPFEYNLDFHGAYYEADGLLKLSNKREINGFIWVKEESPNALPYFVLIDGRPDQPIGYLGFLEKESSIPGEFFPAIQVLPLREISKYLSKQLNPGELRTFKALKFKEEHT